MGLFGKSKEDSLSLVYINLKGVDNYVGVRIKIRLNDESKCVEFIDDDISKGTIKLEIQYSNLYSISRYSERALPTVLSNGTADFIYITKIDYVQDGELKSLTVEEPLLSSLSKRANFTQQMIGRVPIEKPKLNNDLDNSMRAMEAIKRLKELLDIEAITEEEFNKKKTELLEI